MGKKLNISNKFIEAVDESGRSIKGIMGIQIYRNSLIIYTSNAIYSNNPIIFKKSAVLVGHPVSQIITNN